MAVQLMMENILLELRSLMVRRGDLPHMDADPTDGLTNGDLLKRLRIKTKALDAKDDSKKKSGSSNYD